jgi:hypothetical protein
MTGFDHITIKNLLLDSGGRQTDEHIVLRELLVVKNKLIGVGAVLNRKSVTTSAPTRDGTFS